MYYSVLLYSSYYVLRNVSGRPQIVVYRAPSTHHISLSRRERKFFLSKKSHLSHISHHSLDLSLSSLFSSPAITRQQPNNPHYNTTTQQQVKNNMTQQSTMKRHDNNNHTTTTTETTPATTTGQQ